MSAALSHSGGLPTQPPPNIVRGDLPTCNNCRHWHRPNPQLAGDPKYDLYWSRCLRLELFCTPGIASYHGVNPMGVRTHEYFGCMFFEMAMHAAG